MGSEVLERAEFRGLSLLVGAAVFVAACAAPAEVVDERSVERNALYAAWAAGPEAFEDQAERLEEDAELARLWAEDLVLVMVASYRGDGVAAIGEQHGRFERARRALLEMGDVAVEPLVELVLVGNDVGGKLASDLLIEGAERCADAREGFRGIADALEAPWLDRPRWLEICRRGSGRRRHGAAL